MSQKFTFHIPNFFRRDLISEPASNSNPSYSRLPGNEDAEEAEGQDERVAEDESISDRPQPLPSFGVDSTLSWKRKSSTYKTFTWLAFGTLGAAVLLPFNALITPSEYYRSVLASTPYSRSFSSWIIVAYNISTICVGAIATATLEKTTPTKRISISCLVILLSLASFTIYTSKVSLPSVSVDPSSGQNSYFFPLLISLTLILASSTAFLQSSVVGLCASFGGGGKAMGSMLSGQGAVAVALSSVQLIASINQVSRMKSNSTSTSSYSILTEPSSGSESESSQAQKTAMIFFASSALFMLIALFCFFWLSRTEVYNEIESRRIESSLRVQNDAQRVGVGHRERDEEIDDEETGLNSDPLIERSSSDIEEQGTILPNFISRNLSDKNRNYINRMIKIQSKVLISSIAICLVFTVTLGVFPALTSRVQSTSTISIQSQSSYDSSIDKDSRLDDKTSAFNYLSHPLFFTSLHFFLFNLSDLIGRSLPSIKPSIFLIKSFKGVLISSLIRFIFIPLLRSCNLRINNSDPSEGKVTSNPSSSSFSFLSTDLAFFILLILLGLSNGITSTSVFVVGPGSRNTKLKNDERPLAASVISLWLTIGLALGSVSSFWIAR